MIHLTAADVSMLRPPEPTGAQPQAAAGERPQPAQASEEQAVTAQFESMLLEHLLQGMRAGSFAGKADFGRQTFEQMFDAEVARAVAAQGLGLGDTLFAQSAHVRPQETDPPVDRGQ